MRRSVRNRREGRLIQVKARAGLQTVREQALEFQAGAVTLLISVNANSGERHIVVQERQARDRPLRLESAMMMWGDYDGWSWGSHMLIPIVFWLLVVAAIVLAVRWAVRAGRAAAAPAGETPLDILKKRFARGEITREELEDKKRVLEV
jgi:putative membrane protein